jgi:hypothetical protein
MEALSALTAALDQLFIHTAYCISRSTTELQCSTFWSWAIVGSFALTGLAMILLVWKSTSYSIQFYSARLMPLELERAPADESAGHFRWVGGQALASETAGDELEDCIRAALSQIPLVEPVREEVLSKAA